MPQDFLNAIRSLRLRRCPPWRQADLARIVGVSQSRLGAYERGDMMPTLARAFDIANALGHRIEEVFYAAHEDSLRRVDDSGAQTGAPSVAPS